jgi:hypothetical protein
MVWFITFCAVNGTADRTEVTRLLLAWSAGDEQALERLTPLVYQELHRLAGAYMALSARTTPYRPPPSSCESAALAVVELEAVSRLPWREPA